jgi:hypothetical protein
MRQRLVPDPEAGTTRIPSMQRSTIMGAIALCLVAAGAARTAEAHGPCIRNVRMQPCLIPNQGPPGTRVTIVGTWAYRVVWNDPTTAYFLHSKNPYYRPHARTFVLVRIRRARADVRFRVPKVARGRYTVFIYDGEEVGQHFTWDFFRVTRGR